MLFALYLAFHVPLQGSQDLTLAGVYLVLFFSKTLQWNIFNIFNFHFYFYYFFSHQCRKLKQSKKTTMPQTIFCFIWLSRFLKSKQTYSPSPKICFVFLSWQYDHTDHILLNIYVFICNTCN